MKVKNVKCLHNVNKRNVHAYISSFRLKLSKIDLFCKFELILTLATKYILSLEVAIISSSCKQVCKLIKTLMCFVVCHTVKAYVSL